MKQKVLMVMAHPDDEVIFGWPILQNPEYEPEILICSHKGDRKKRFLALCEYLKIKGHVLDVPCRFYNFEIENDTRKKFLTSILHEIDKRRFDKIFTHNPWGEYGHDDHRLINTIVYQNYNNVLTTDTFIQSNWLPDTNSLGCISKFRYSDDVDTKYCENDLEHYNKCMSFYGNNAWGKEPIKKTTLCEF